MKNILGYLTLCLLTASCIDESNEKQVENLAQGQVKVTLTLSLPAQATPTYALDLNDENEVKTIDVLAFKADGSSREFAYRAKAQGTDIQPGTVNTKQITITLTQQGTNQYIFVFLANATQQIDAAFPGGIGVGMVKDDVLKRLILSGVDRWNVNESGDIGSYRQIPMWGETSTPTSITSATTFPNLVLVRMVAKIDVKVDRTIIEVNRMSEVNFKLTSVHLYRYHKNGRITPDAANMTPGLEDRQVSKPTMIAEDTHVAGSQIYDATNSNLTDDEVVNSIYTFESAVPTTDVFDNVTCLVIGGSYQLGAETFYRVDFGTKDPTTKVVTYKDLLRNQHYEFTITSVTGPGDRTPEEALKSNKSVTIGNMAWNMETIATSIGRELYVSQSDVTLYNSNQHIVYFTSNQPTVTIDEEVVKVYKSVESTESYTTSLQRDENFSYTYNAETGRGDGWIKIISNPAFEYFSFRKINLNAGGLKRQITITKEIVFAMSNIVLNDAGNGYTFAEDVTALTTKGIKANFQGLSFKWGSLIGVSGVTNNQVSSNPFWDATTFIPYKNFAGYTGTTLASALFSEIPYRSENLGNYAQDHDEFKTVYTTVGSIGYDVATGKGDICRYMSDQGWVNGRWRIPTSAEMSTYYAAGTFELSNPTYYGLKFGSFTSDVDVPVLHTGRDVITSGYYLGPGVVANTSTTLTDRKIVSLPAAGYRNSATHASNGVNGLYWSSSANNGTKGWYLEFVSTTTYQEAGTRSTGFSVRCVRDL